MIRNSYWHFIRPDAIRALHDETIRKTLSWYYSVLIEDYPAKFHIVKTIEVPKDNGHLNSLDIDGLWSLHKELGKIFSSLWREVWRSGIKFKEFKNKYREVTPNLLDLEAKIAFNILKNCRFCEWKCGVDRTAGDRGFCRLDHRSYVHSWFLHIGEEAPLVPSGTIFYGSCNFRCVFCQNWDISQESPFNGIEVTPQQLSLIQKELKNNGARNINHVGGDPTPNIYNIIESMKILDVNIPQLWNSNFYMSEEALQLLIYIIDIWLPDFKYGNNACAKRLSGIPNYLEIVGRNHRVAIEWGDMIIRHLVLPNHVECCSKPVLKWIASNLPRDKVLVNIMDQYRPEYKAHKYIDINRRVNSKELEEIYKYADELKLLWREVS